MAVTRNALLQVPEAVGDVIFNIPNKSFIKGLYVYNTGIPGAVASKADPVAGAASFGITSPAGTHVIIYSNVVGVAIRTIAALNGGGLGGYTYFTHNEATEAKWKALNDGLADLEAERLKETEQTMVRALSVLTEITTKKTGKVATK